MTDASDSCLQCGFADLIVHVKVWLVDRLPSDTITVTVCVPALAADRIPEMVPDAGSIVRPGGSPTAL